MTIFLLSVLAFSLAFAGTDVCKDAEQKVREHSGGKVPFEVVSKKPQKDSCQLLLKLPQGNIVPTYVYDDYIIVGTKFVRGRSPSIEEMSRYKREEVRALASKLSSYKYVSYKPKNVKKGKYFYFISDPDCPYCERMKGKVKELADKYGWEVRVIWMPLPIHPQAKGKAISFLCENRTYEDYLKGKYGNKECKEEKENVERAERELLPIVRGTPTFIFPNGEIVHGADEKALEEVMKGWEGS